MGFAFSAPEAMAVTVDSTILVLAANAADAYSASSGLNGYGIPTQTLIVPQYNATLPQLNSSSTHGNYGGIVTISELYYSGTGSALSPEQWADIYAYQIAFGTRLVRLGAYPSADFGVSSAGGCCGTGVEQYAYISNSSAFSTANLVTGAELSTSGLWHNPAVITSPSTTQEIVKYGPSSDGTFKDSTTAAVINTFAERRQMVFFLPWATSWSQTSNVLQHAYIHWLTRGCFLGARKLYFSTQIDDVHMATNLYYPAGSSFRLRPEDLDMHVKWQTELNARLPPGSNYYLEMGHNGNGDVYNATKANNSASVCNPNNAILYPAPPITALEFYKPLGTGADVWPLSAGSNYTWSTECATLDPLATWFSKPENRDQFSHLSHTFSHLYLNNATYSDTSKEITFNIAWLKQLALDQGSVSMGGLIPPAITGMHNGDAIKAWMDNGITSVVGDNSRGILRDSRNEYWPAYSSVDVNGYDGLLIMGRWPTRIYFDCDSPACNLQEWVTVFAGTNDWKALLDAERTSNTRYLLALRHDSFMFHQANMRVADVPVATVGKVTQQLSMLQSWVETVTQEMTRLTNWPLVTLKHDDLAIKFAERKVRDECIPSAEYTLSADRKKVTHITVKAVNMDCAAPIPVTVPWAATTEEGTKFQFDRLGSEPPINWITLQGKSVKLSLWEALPV